MKTFYTQCHKTGYAALLLILSGWGYSLFALEGGGGLGVSKPSSSQQKSGWEPFCGEEDFSPMALPAEGVSSLTDSLLSADKWDCSNIASAVREYTDLNTQYQALMRISMNNFLRQVSSDQIIHSKKAQDQLGEDIFTVESCMNSIEERLSDLAFSIKDILPSCLGQK